MKVREYEVSPLHEFSVIQSRIENSERLLNSVNRDVAKALTVLKGYGLTFPELEPEPVLTKIPDKLTKGSLEHRFEERRKAANKRTCELATLNRMLHERGVKYWELTQCY